MPRIASDETKLIPSERWMGWFDTFTNGNRGRLISIEVVDDEAGDAAIVEDMELVAIDYDPVGKGNVFTISYGDDENPSRHSVENPTALWQGQDVNGVVVALEIESGDGTHTIITLF